MNSQAIIACGPTLPRSVEAVLVGASQRLTYSPFSLSGLAPPEDACEGAKEILAIGFEFLDPEPDKRLAAAGASD